MFLICPVYAAKDYGKQLQGDVRNTKREIKREITNLKNQLTKNGTAEEIPEWYPNADGSLMTFPLKEEDCFMVGDRVSITSWYTLVRSDTNGLTYKALNIPARPNSPVYAIADGLVTATGDARFFRPERRPYTGMFIEITSKSGLVVSYEHLNDWSVCRGDYVLAGDEIGCVGGSGRTTGFHLRLVGVYEKYPVCLSEVFVDKRHSKNLTKYFGKKWYPIAPGDLEHVGIK